MILLKDALQMMEERDHRNWPIPFSITFVTYDKERQTGGEIITLNNVVLAKNRLVADKKATGRTTSKNAPANQWQNATRNFYLLDSQQIRKANIRLLTHFNNQPIVY